MLEVVEKLVDFMELTFFNGSDRYCTVHWQLGLYSFPVSMYFRLYLATYFTFGDVLQDDTVRATQTLFALIIYKYL